MKLLILSTMILINGSHSEWNLIWNEEFNHEIIDKNKWETENESNHCYGLIFFVLFLNLNQDYRQV
jgi:hypothetical protein